MNISDNDRSLGHALAGWRVSAGRNPQFRAQVWARIEATRAAPPWSDYARHHAALVAGVLAIAVVVGALTGRERARSLAEAQRTAVAAAYVHALDARWMRSP